MLREVDLNSAPVRPPSVSVRKSVFTAEFPGAEQLSRTLKCRRVPRQSYNRATHKQRGLRFQEVLVFHPSFAPGLLCDLESLQHRLRSEKPGSNRDRRHAM